MCRPQWIPIAVPLGALLAAVGVYFAAIEILTGGISAATLSLPLASVVISVTQAGRTANAKY